MPYFIEVQKDKNGEPAKVRRKKKIFVEMTVLNELAEIGTVRLRIEMGYKVMRKKILKCEYWGFFLIVKG